MNEKPPSSGTRVEKQSASPASTLVSSQSIAPTSSASRAGDPSMDVRLQILRFEADAIKERAAEASANEKLAEARIIELESHIRINLQRFEDYERRIQAAAFDLAQEKKVRAVASEEFQHRLDELNSDLARARTALQIKQDEVDRLRLLSEALKRDIESIDQPRLSQLISDLTSSLESERAAHQVTQKRSIELQDELTQKLSELTVMKNKFLSALDQRQVEKQALLSDIDQLKSQIESLQQEKSELLSNIERAKSEQQELESKLGQSEQLCKSLTTEIEQLKTDLVRANQDLTVALEEKNAFSLNLREKEDQGFRHKDKILQAESRAASLQEKVDRVLLELKATQEQLKLVENEKSELMVQIQHHGEADLQVKNALFMSETRATSTLEQMEQCKVELSVANESIAQQRESLEQERTRSAELMRSYSQLQFVVEQLKIERQHDSEIAAQRFRELSLNIEQEKEKQKSAQTVITSQLEEIRKYAEKTHEQELKLLQLNTELMSRHEQAQELSALMEQGRVKYEEVNAQLSVYKAELDRERALKATLECRQVSLDHEIKKLFQEKEDIYRLSIEKVEKERAENLNLVARYENLEVSAFEANTRVESLTDEMRAERSQNQELVQSLNEQIQELRNQLSEVSAQVERLNHLNESLKQELESIDQPAMNQAIADLHATLEAERNGHLEAQARNIDLQESLSQRTTELSLFKSKLAGCSDQRQEDEDRFRKEVEKLNAQIDQLILVNKSLAEYKEKIREKSDTISMLEAQKAALVIENDERSRKFQEELKLDREGAARRSQDLCDRIAELQGELEEVKAQLMRSGELIQVKQEEADRLRHLNESLQRDIQNIDQPKLTQTIVGLTEQLEAERADHLGTQTRIIDFQDTISRQMSEIGLLKTKLAACSSQNEAEQRRYMAELSELREQVKKLSLDAEALKERDAQCLVLQSELTESHAKKAESEALLEKARAELEALHQEASVYKTQIANEKLSKQELERRISGFEADIKRLIQEKADLNSSKREQSQVHEKTLVQMEQQARQNEAEIHKHELAALQLKNDVNNLSEKNGVLSDSITELRTKLDQALSQLDAERTALALERRSNLELTERNNALDSRLKEATAENQLHHQQSLALLQQEHSKFSELLARSGQLQSAVERLTHEKQALTQDLLQERTIQSKNLNEYNEKLANLQSELESSGNKTAQILELQAQLEKLGEEKTAALSASEQKLLSQLEAQSAALAVERKNNIELTERNDALDSRLKEATAEMQLNYQKSLALLNQEHAKFSDLLSRSGQLELTVERLTQELLHERANQSKNSIELNEKLANLQLQVESSSSQAVQILELRAQLEKMTEEKTAAISEGEQKLEKIKQELSRAHEAEISARSVEFERRLQAVSQELVEERSAARYKAQHLQDQLETMSRELETKNGAFEKLQAQAISDRQIQEQELLQERRAREEFNERTFAQKAEFSEKIHAYEIAGLNLKNEIRQREQEVRTLQGALEQRDLRAADLTAELQEMRERLKQSADLVAQERQLLEQERMQTESLNAQCNRAESSIRLKQEEVEKLRHLNESLRRDIEAMDVENLRRVMAEQAQELELERRKSAETAKLCSELQESITRQRSEMGLLQNSLTSVLEKTRDEALAQENDSHNSLDEAMQSLLSQKLQLEGELAQASDSRRLTKRAQAAPQNPTPSPSRIPRSRKKATDVEI